MSSPFSTLERTVTFIQQVSNAAHVSTWEFMCKKRAQGGTSTGELCTFYRARLSDSGGLRAILQKLTNLNRNGWDIYCRPSPGTIPTRDHKTRYFNNPYPENHNLRCAAEGSCIAYPYFVLDDLPPQTALRIASRWRSAVVKTSEEGGCQVWIFTAGKHFSGWMDVQERHEIQKEKAKAWGGDPGATAGDQFFRLPGFRNWKRGGQWVNLVKISRNPDYQITDKPDVEVEVQPETVEEQKPFYPGIDEFESEKAEPEPEQDAKMREAEPDEPFQPSPGQDRSRLDWRDVLKWLGSGCDPETCVSRIATRRTADRGKRDALRYAKLTVKNAQKAICA